MKDGQAGALRGQYPIELDGSFVAEDVSLDSAGRTAIVLFDEVCRRA